MKKRDLIVMIGAPGSSKTTVATLLESLGFIRFSADAVRGELYGNEAEQGNPAEVFSVLNRRLKKFLNTSEGNCVIDNTNTSSRDRRNIIDLIENPEFFNIRYWLFDIPVEVCLERNRNRDRKVPETSIIKKCNAISVNKVSLIEQADLVIGVEGINEKDLRKCLGF
jgi:predicted kinase